MTVGRFSEFFRSKVPSSGIRSPWRDLLRLDGVLVPFPTWMSPSAFISRSPLMQRTRSNLRTHTQTMMADDSLRKREIRRSSARSPYIYHLKDIPMPHDLLIFSLLIRNIHLLPGAGFHSDVL